jgi:hypothetical protein
MLTLVLLHKNITICVFFFLRFYLFFNATLSAEVAGVRMARVLEGKIKIEK